jgi:pullulanase
MKEVERELRALRPDIALYGEPWGGGPGSPMKQPTNKQTITGTKLGAFNDDFRNTIIGSPFDSKHGAFLQEGTSREAVQRSLEGQWRNWSDGPYQVINYLSCHDNYVMFDKLKASKPGASDADVIEMMKLGYLLLFTAQGVPFIHGGEEFARNKQGHENSYNAPDEINQVDWSLKEKHRDLFNYVRDLIALRKAHPVFRLRTKKQIQDLLKFTDPGDPHVLVAAYEAGKVEGEPWPKALVIVNAADTGNAEVKLPAGVWRIAFDQTGAVTSKDRAAEGTITVRHKSGLILFQ